MASEPPYLVLTREGYERTRKYLLACIRSASGERKVLAFHTMTEYIVERNTKHARECMVLARQQYYGARHGTH